MILTPKIVARLIVVGLLGVLLQLTFFSQVELFHISPDILPALVVVMGLLGGSLTGAVSGFAIGFLLDCLLIQPLGGASLVLIAVGFAAGTFRERFEIHSRLVVPLLCALLTRRTGTFRMSRAVGRARMAFPHRPGRSREANRRPWLLRP